MQDGKTKQYYVQLPDYPQGELWDEDKYNRNKEALFSDHEDAMVFETTKMDPASEIDPSASYTVHLPDYPDAEVWDADKLSRNRAQLLQDHPDVEIYNTKRINHWGDQLGEIYDRRAALLNELEGLPADDAPVQGDPRAMTGSINEMAREAQERRNSPAMSRRLEINSELKELDRLQENNPAWRNYRDSVRQNIDTQSSQLDELAAKLAADNPEADKKYQRSRFAAGPYAASAMAGVAANSDPEYNSNMESIAAAKLMLSDARDVATAPTRYGDDGQNPFKNFFVGGAKGLLGAVSVANLVKGGMDMHLVDAVKKIQDTEQTGAATDILAFAQNGDVDKADYLNAGEKALIKAFATRASAERDFSERISRAYQAGQIAAQSLGFMADFLAMGGVGEAVADAAVGNVVKAAGRNKLAKLGAETLYGTVKAMAMTPLMPSSYANFVNNITQMDSAGAVDLSGKNMLKAAGDVLIENISETVGAKPMELLTMPLQKVSFPGWAKALHNAPVWAALKQAGYNGFFEEMVEEWTGNALRVMTGVDKDALKDFAKVDQQLITAGAFAPMSLLGLPLSVAQYSAASKDLKAKGAVLEDVLKESGLTDEQRQSLMSTDDFDTPEAFAKHMGDVYRQMVDAGGNEADAYRAVMNYTQAAARYKVMTGLMDEQKDVERSTRLADMDTRIGASNWHHEGRNGVGYVRIITDADGHERFVVSSGEGLLALVDEQGNKSFLDENDLAAGIADGTMSDSGEEYLFDYLDRRGETQRIAQEQERIAAETQQSYAELQQQALPGMQVNLGTVESPEMGTFMGADGGQYIVQKPDGTTIPMSPDEVLAKLGIGAEPKSDAQLQEDESQRILQQDEKRRLGNEYKGQTFVYNGQMYTLVGVTRGHGGTYAEDGTQISARPFDVHATDAQGHNVTLEYDEADYDGLLGSLSAQPEATQEDAPVVQDVNDDIPRDFRGNPLPLRINKLTNEQVVDGNALWNRDPEAWARWNDTNPNQRVGSKERLEYTIGELGKEIDKDTKAVQKAALKGMDEDEMDKMEAALATKLQRRDLLTSILAKYNMPAAPAAETFAGEQRKAAAEEVKTEQQAGFPGIQQRWNAAEKVEGAPDEIRLANGETLAGRYILTDASAPTPSHNPADGFKMSGGFPVDENGKTVNDRDYERDAAAQQAVIEKAASYDQRAVQTPVIVSPDGVVLSGNDRTMASQLAAQNGTDHAYVDYVAKYAQRYGFTPEQVSQFEHPRVVFVPDEAMPYDAATFAKFNREDKKSQNKTEKAVKAGKTISAEALGQIATLINQYDDINALYNDAEGVDSLIKIMLADGIISQEQVAALKDGDLLSGTGMDMLESTLIGAALDEEAVRLAMADRSLRKPVVTAIAQIIANNTIEGYTLRTELNDAILLIAQGKSAGEIKLGESVQSFIRQQHLFMDDVVASATVQMLADAINDRKTSQLKKVLSLYNKDAVDSATGQMNLLTGDILSREAILRNILQYLGYDTKFIFDTSEREAEQRAAAQAAGGAEQTDEAQQNDAPVQSDAGSRVANFNREEVAAILEQGNVGETGLADVMTDDEVAEFMRLWDVFLPYNDALGEAYSRLGDDLRASAKKEKRKAAQAGIDRLELAQQEAFAPIQDYVDSLLSKYELDKDTSAAAIEIGTEAETPEVVDTISENVEDGIEEDLEEVVDEEEPGYSKKKKGKKEEKKPQLLTELGGAREKTILATEYTEAEFEEFYYGSCFGTRFSSKRLQIGLTIFAVGGRSLKDEPARVRVEKEGNYVGEFACTPDYLLRYLKANKYKRDNKTASKKNQYGYWVNTCGVIMNPVEIVLPSTHKGWVNFQYVKIGRANDGKWSIGISLHTNTGGWSSPVSGDEGEYDTKAKAIQAALDAAENYLTNNFKETKSKSYEQRDLENLIRTLKTKTLPQALMEEGVLNAIPRVEVDASALDSGFQGELFAETVSGTVAEETADEPAIEKETGNVPDEIITFPGMDAGSAVSKVGLKEKDGLWYWSAYVAADGGNGSAWGSSKAMVQTQDMGEKTRSDAIAKAVDYMRFILSEPAKKQSSKYGETFSDTKQLIDYLVKIEVDKKEEAQKETREDALRYIKNSLYNFAKNGNYARIVRTIEAYHDFFGDDVAEDIDTILKNLRANGISKESKDEMVRQVSNLYNRLVNPEAETEAVEKPSAPAYGSQNTIITTDKYEELKKRMQEKLNQLNAGFDPEAFFIGAQMAAYHVEAGARKFIDFSRRMISDLGDAIRPYLKAIYNGARDLPGMEQFRPEMDSASDVDAIDVESINVEQPVNETPASSESAEMPKEEEPAWSRRDDMQIQGLEDLSMLDIYSLIEDHIDEVMADAVTEGFNGFALVDMIPIGSRAFGTAREDSDLDILLEYEGDAKEDAVFNLLNEKPLEILGIKVDFFPIRSQQSGTISEWLESHNNGRPVEKEQKRAESEPVVKQVDVEGLLGAVSDMYQGKRSEVKLSEFAQPVEQIKPGPSEAISAKATIGDLGKYTHTKTGKEMSIVRLSGDRLSSDEFKKLKARAKEYGGYYSSFGSAKGFLFDNEEDAIRFNTLNTTENVSENTDKQTAAITAVISSQAASVAEQAAAIAEAAEPADERKASRVIQKIDDQLEKIDDQLALLGYYEAEQDVPFNEMYGYMKSAEKKAVKDAEKLARKLAADLGINVGRKKLATANIAPAGGEVTFRLPLNEGRELYVNIDVVPDRDDNLFIGGVMGRKLSIMYRIKQPSESGLERYGSNNFAPYNVTYSQFLKGVRNIADKYLDKAPSAQTEGPVDILEIVKTQAEKNRKSGKKTVSSQSDGDDMLGGLFDTLASVEGPTPDNEVDTPTPAERVKPVEVNGFAKGEKVFYTPNQGKSRGQTVEANIYDFEYDGRPVLDTGLAPVLYEVVEWSQVRKIENEPVNETDNGLPDEQGGRPRSNADARGTSSGQQQGLHQGAGEESGEPGQESERTDRGGEGGRSGDVHGRSRTLRPRYDDSVKRNTRNYRLAKGDEVPKTIAARYKANIAAIRLLKELQDSGKQATKEQMAVLRQYTGWGGLGGYFNNEYSPEYREMSSLLTDEELQAAALSINTAYYTPTEIIESMWDVAKRLGFEGGNVLEGSAGIGNILASMPKNISERSAITAVELDSITGGILQQLYPDADVQIKGFQEVDIPNGSVDLAITNVPFGDINVYDSKEKDLTRKFGGKIHDFCIAKNIRKLAEGGIGIFISTRGTLDGSSKALRQWIVNEGEADVIGAFRLNNATFEGTKATSDIIVVRKRVNGQVSPNAINVTDTEITRRVDYNTGDTEWNKNTRKWEPITGKAAMEINDYFVEHPENMGGEMGFGFEHKDSYRPGSSALWPSEKIDQNKRLAKWARQFSSIQEEVAPTAAATGSVEEDVNATKEGQLITNSKGEICISRSGKAVPLGVNAQKVKGYTKAQVLADYDALKTAITKVLTYQLSNESDEGLKPLLSELNKAYDRFAKRYDRLNRNTAISFLRNDVDFPSIAAVEDYKEKKGIDGKVKIEVKKTSIFSGRVLGAKRIPTPSNAKDGVIVSINQFGRIDIPFIAEALNKDEDTVRNEILSSGLGFENPLTGGVEVEYEYLSGNVREKLEYARAHNFDGLYDNNIKALEKVIPADIPAHLIEFSLGSDWMPVELYTEYAKEKFGVNDNFVPAIVGGSWVLPENEWDMNVNTEQNRAAGVHSEGLRMDKKGHELMIAAMNNTSIVFSRKYKDSSTGETVTEYDREATQAATTKMSEMRDDFKEWSRARMLDKPELAERISKIYNDTFNAIVPKEIRDTFIPEHFEGMATKLNNGKPLNLRMHQAKAVIRATTEPLMMAHEVGTGKTFTLIATAMEMRRLGTAKKPMIVVQNSTLGQFVSSAKELYPNAKILTISEADRTVEGRTAFYAKIKYNDWDMVVVPQSVFEMIPDSEERQKAFIQEKIAEKKFILEQAKEAKNATAERQLKKELEDLEYEYQYGEKPPKKGKVGKKDAKKEAEAVENAVAKAKKQLDRRTDDVSDFDDMGIDALLVDEAHSYKHLGFSTAMQRGVKGVDATGSKKSAGVYLKTRSIFDKVGWKNVVFATGTPISNTAAEIWTFMKYLMPSDIMRQNHIYYFDDFIRNFGNISQSLEFTTSGKFKETTRFAAYTNLPELIRIWSSVTDTVRSADAVAEGNEKLEDKQPKMEGGQARDIYLPQSPSLVDIMNAVRAKLEWYENLSGKEKKENSHIPLTMFGIAKMAAIDPRLVDREAQDEPNSKTNKAVEETLQALKDSAKYNGAAALFCDNFRRWDTDASGKRVEGFNIFEEIKRKLIAAGVPEGQIVIIKSGMNTAAKEKIFARVNSGEVRVIMGTTATLGTGVNIQERLFFEAHLDAPNRPMDYTQRNGRILRQGNLHKDWNIPVRVVRFGVEDSLDVTAYQRLSTKAKFIDSVMNGKPLLANGMDNRVLEEEEEGEFDNPVAVLSGSQYALLKSQAERELRKLRNKKEQHRQDQIYIERTLKENKSRIAYDEKLIEENKNNLAKIKAAFHDGKVNEISIEGHKAKGTEQIAEAIKDRITTPIRSQIERRRNDRSFDNETLRYKIAFDGVSVTIDVEVSRNNEYDDKTGKFKTVMRTRVEYSCPQLGLKEQFVQGGYLAIKDVVSEFVGDIATGAYYEGKINRLTNTINRINNDNELMLQRRGKPFADEEKLKKQEEIVKDYTEKMRAEMAEKEAKYAEMAKNVASTFNVDDIEIEDNDDEEDSVHNREIETAAPMLDANDPFVVAQAASAVNRLASRLGLRVVYDNSLASKGSYKEGTDYVTINLANCESVDDAVETLLHEGVAHFGLRQLLGRDGMTDFINDVLQNASRSIINKIEQLAAENGWSREYAAEEYIAELAQKTDYTRPEHSFWRRVLQAVRNLIDMITGRQNRITDDTIREMLVASYANLNDNANFVDSNGKGSEQNQINHRRDSGRVSQYRSSAVQISSDLRDIRVLEPESSVNRHSYSGDSEGDYQRRQDREAESGRLIAAAKSNGLYISPDKLGTLGVHKPGNSMESEIYVDIDNGRYIKVKDPFASVPMTQNSPFDAIYQHIVHNIYFPEAPYQFLGISEKTGDVRIVLAQKTVKTFEEASPNQAKEYLLNRGYSTKDGYTFENEDVVVTDLEEDNLLITRDDKGNIQYHPIDPIIKYKIPAREIIDKATGGEEGITHYRRRTNLNSETDPWNITGAMKVKRILTDEEVDNLVRAAGREPQEREPIVRNRVAYHGSIADFDAFDINYAGTGEGFLSHGYGHYVALGRNTAVGYAWSNAFDYADRQGLISGSIAEILRNDSFDDYDSMVERYDELHAKRLEDIRREIAEERKEKTPDMSIIRTLEAELSLLEKDRPLREVFEGMRNIYTVEIPDDTGDNYIDEMKTLAKSGRRRIAEVVRKQDASLLQTEKYGPNWLPNGLETLANVIEREQLAGIDLRRRLSAAFGSEKEASRIMHEAGFVGIKYDGRSDGPCAVIFSNDDLHIVNHERFREGGMFIPSSVSYSESMGAKRLSANETARKCGIQIEFRPPKEMMFAGKPLAGRWVDGTMYICLEHCRDAADAVRTVLHEGVGHNGLRRLIGNENMTAFCIDVFNRLPEQARKAIAEAAVNQYGANVVEAVEEYLAERAEVMDFENEDYERNFWDIVLDALRKVLAKVGIAIPLSQRDVRWLLWQSYNANKQDDMMNQIQRQVVANKLGFSLRQQADKGKAVQVTRNKIAAEYPAEAARIYNKDVLNMWSRLHETWVDKDDAVNRLVEAIEKATGSKADSFEDIRLSLNQQSSKGLAAITQWDSRYNRPMWNAIIALMKEKGIAKEDVERYVMIKHGLERNEVFAKRDAREYYQEIHDDAVNAIKSSEKMDEAEREELIAKEDAKLEQRFKAIENGTDFKYKELRKEDYGGLTAMYSDYDAIEPFMEGVESQEEYQARVLSARHPKYTYFDAEGHERVDMEATEEAARDEVKDFEMGHAEAVADLWRRINAATKATLRHQYNSNMLSRAQYEQVRDMFKYYVPLRGFSDNTAEDMYDYYRSDQRKDFNPPLQKAKGRKTEAESPFGYIAAMANSGIAADMKNSTKLALYYFVSNRPNDLVNISEVWYEKIGEEDGKDIFSPVYPHFKDDLSSTEAKEAYSAWEKEMQEKAKMGMAFKGRRKLNLHNSVIHIDNSQKDSHIIKFKVGGRDMMMYINGNPRAAQAINNELNVEMSADYQKVFGKILRWFAGINTSYNPEFWLSNLQRDIVFSLMSVNVTDDKEYNKAFRENLGRMLKNTLTPKAHDGAYSLMKKLQNGELGDSHIETLYKEFVNNGGVTGYTTVKNNEEWELELRKYVGDEKKAIKAIKNVFDKVQNFGEAIEQLTRFTAYMTSRDQGKGIKAAIGDAKELTVNFNRKGSGKAISFKEAEKLRTKDGKKLNGVQKAFVVAASWIPVYGRRFIIFFNASVQGLNKLYDLTKNNPRKVGLWAAGFFALGAIQAIIHAMMDDDDEYLDLPDYLRHNNLLLGGDGVFLTWALPQECRVFYGLGDMVVNHSMGRTPNKMLAGELLASMSDIAPLNPAGGIAAIAPSALTPVVEVALNRDYKGSKIFNDLRYLSDEERKRTPAYQRAYLGTGKPYIVISQFANWLTGGDYADAGWLNINPAAVEHIVQGATGGAGTTLGKLYRGTVGQALGEDLMVRNTPFLSRLLTVTDERYRNAHTTDLFDYYKAEAEHTKKLINTYRKNGDVEKLDKLYDSDEVKIWNIYESYKGALQWYNDELKATVDSDERRELMREQDALRKEMILEISNIGKND